MVLIIESSGTFKSFRKSELIIIPGPVYASFSTEQSNYLLKKKNVEVLKNRFELTTEQFDD